MRKGREKDRQRKGKNDRSKERGEKIEKGEVVLRKKGKGEAEKNKKRETEEGRRGYMKIEKIE